MSNIQNVNLYSYHLIQIRTILKPELFSADASTMFSKFSLEDFKSGKSTLKTKLKLYSFGKKHFD